MVEGANLVIKILETVISEGMSHGHSASVKFVIASG